MVKYDKINVCVELVYCLTLRMTIFEKILLDDILLTLLTKHHVIMAERAYKKTETLQSDTVG